jgi:hypothetical protein
MVIHYRKQYLRTDLIIGSLYILAGVAGFIFQSGPYNFIIGSCFSLGGFFFLGSYYYKQKHQYLQMENNVLTYWIFGSKKRSVDLREITRIKKFADEITFFTPYKKLKISTNMIAGEDLPVIKNLLASLDLEPEKNPFKKAIVKTT